MEASLPEHTLPSCRPRCVPNFPASWKTSVVDTAISGVASVSVGVFTKYASEFQSAGNQWDRYVGDISKGILLIVIAGLAGGVVFSGVRATNGRLRFRKHDGLGWCMNPGFTHGVHIRGVRATNGSLLFQMQFFSGVRATNGSLRFWVQLAGSCMHRGGGGGFTHLVHILLKMKF